MEGVRTLAGIIAFMFSMEFTMTKPCPDEETLVDYIEGRLSEEDRSQVEEHLSDCPICLESFVVTQSMLRERDRFESVAVPTEVTETAVNLVSGQKTLSPGYLMEKAKRSIAGLGSDMLNRLGVRPWARWQFAPIRGSKTVTSEDLVSLKVPIGEIETEIEIEKTAPGKALIRVRMDRAAKLGKGIRVTLKRGEREMASDLLDRDCLLFEDIPFGHYSISLIKDGVKLGEYVFEIRETRNGKR